MSPKYKRMQFKFGLSENVSTHCKDAKASKQEMFLKFVTSFLQVLAQAKKFVRVLALLMEMSRGLEIGTVGLSGFQHLVGKVHFIKEILIWKP